MSKAEILEILKNIKFRDWKFHFDFVESKEPVVLQSFCSNGNAMYLQVQFLEKDHTSEVEVLVPQHGRKWLLSPHMTKSEIVQTAFLAVLTAMEHEVREEFKYKGQAIFNPHWNVEVLYQSSIFYKKDDRPVKVDGFWEKEQ